MPNYVDFDMCERTIMKAESKLCKRSTNQAPKCAKAKKQNNIHKQTTKVQDHVVIKDVSADNVRDVLKLMIDNGYRPIHLHDAGFPVSMMNTMNSVLEQKCVQFATPIVQRHSATEEEANAVYILYATDTECQELCETEFAKECVSTIKWRKAQHPLSPFLQEHYAKRSCLRLRCSICEKDFVAKNGATMRDHNCVQISLPFSLDGLC